jgi:hypothetical protein
LARLDSLFSCSQFVAKFVQTHAGEENEDEEKSLVIEKKLSPCFQNTKIIHMDKSANVM